MDDVKPDITEEALPQAEDTADQTSQSDDQTANTEEVSSVEAQPQTPQERMVPLSVLQKERKMRQEIQRKLAEKDNNLAMSQFDSEDLDQIIQHPFVQELIIKDARQQLTDYARETLDQYPTLHPQVKKAILKNVRGFVNESTSDVETAKLDLLEYIEQIAEEAGAEQAEEQPSTKTFPVANTNVPSTEDPAIRPADVEAILSKPMDEWTPTEEQTVRDYRRRNPNK